MSIYMKELHRTDMPLRNNALHFAAPGLSARAGCTPLAANHSYGYAFCLHAHPALRFRRHPSAIMKNPG